MLELLSPGRIGLAIAFIFLIYIARFLQKFHFHRTLFKGLPGPPHSYLWGSLRSMGEVIKDQPRKASPQGFPLLLKERYGLGDYFYMDPYPFGDPIMIILNTELMNDITVKQSFPKHPEVEKFMQHVGGPGNLVSAEGAEWKKWRSAFNPGFSAAHLMTLVPLIVDQCDIFCDIMTKRAKNNDLFRMEQATTKLTVDIIGKVVLDLDFGAQKGPNELVDTLINQVKWQPIGAQFNPSELIDIRRPIVMRYNTWKMNRYIAKRLDERFATRAGRGKTKAVIDLALEAYLKEVKGTSGDVESVIGIDSVFKNACISNMKTFIFAGHDTTSATLCYAYYYLSKNPASLEKIRKELDNVFGSDPSAVAEQLKQDSHILNRLDYTMAVTRETLRLQPPASTIRVGQKGVFLRDPDTNEALPTEHFMLWPVDVGFGRSKQYWGDPDVFRPERYLSADGYNKDAWVPFSKGVRNCIGQELAILETKIILAMTLRSFDFKSAFDELEKLKGDGSGYPSDTSGIQEQYGDEAYQIQLGTAKPREGMPCRIHLRK